MSDKFFGRFLCDFRMVSTQVLEMFLRSLSSRLAAFWFAPNVLFLSLTSFTVCHTNYDCLSSTESLILLIWPWVYSWCSLGYVLVRSHWAFFPMAFVGFLFTKYALFSVLSFFCDCYWLQGNSAFASLFGCCCLFMDDKIFKFLFRVCFWDVPRRVSHLFLIVTVYWLLISLLISGD